MFAKSRCARILSVVAALGMMISPTLGAGPIVSQPAKPKVFDVRLMDGGKLVGQVVNAAGVATPDARVVLAAGAQALTQAKSDAMGRFVVNVPKSGVYHVAVANRTFVVRAWQADMAPPSAKAGLLCVADGVTVRGQCGGCGAAGCCEPTCEAAGGSACGTGGGCFGGGGGRAMSILTNPLVLGLGVAAAIALPIALDDDDDDDNGGGGGAGEPPAS